MEIAVSGSIRENGPRAAVVVPFFESDSLSDIPEVTQVGGEALAGLMEREEVRSSLFDITLLHSRDGDPALLFVGAGKRDELNGLTMLRVWSAASRYLTGRSYDHLVFVDRRTAPPFDFGHQAAQGAILGAYDEGLKKTKKEQKRRLDGLTLVTGDDARTDAERGAYLGQVVGESTCWSRDLVNLPPNELTPTALAQAAQDMAQTYGLQFNALDEGGMRDLGMGSLLGVASGSDQPPRLIELRYGDAGASIRLALVGKGLTFDSGGLSLKPAEGMEDMKADMGGAAAVLGGMAAVARLGPENVSVTGYIGATENMPGGRAMRPGDVLTAMNGETIEVLNTDAEGRLVLADVLAYAVSQGATQIVDFATLTGAAMVALGYAATLATGRPMDWVSRVVSAASAGLERAWPMPLYPEYRKVMDSTIADIKNSGMRWGGALNAAAFLGDFVAGVPWAHMDIAGTAWADDPSPYQPKGGTGEGVGTIAALVRSLSEGG